MNKSNYFKTLLVIASALNSIQTCASTHDDGTSSLQDPSKTDQSLGVKQHLKCSNCSKSELECKLAQCNRCPKILYCSTACQKAAWPTHKSDCLEKEKEFYLALALNTLGITTANNESILNYLKQATLKPKKLDSEGNDVRASELEQLINEQRVPHYAWKSEQTNFPTISLILKINDCLGDALKSQIKKKAGSRWLLKITQLFALSNSLKTPPLKLYCHTKNKAFIDNQEHQTENQLILSELQDLNHRQYDNDNHLKAVFNEAQLLADFNSIAQRIGISFTEQASKISGTFELQQPHVNIIIIP